MKKIVFFIFMFIVAMTTTNAQYSNATLNGPWLLYQNPLTPYHENFAYILFDGNGSITDFGGFGTFSGNYSVNATGAFSGILNMDEGSFPLSGQLTSQNTATMGDYILSRVTNPGALSGTIAGVLNSACGSATVTLTVDNQGKIIGATGLTPPVTGRIYTDLEVYIGHLKTGVPRTGNSHWNEFSIMGYYTDNKLNGKIGLDAGPNDCESTVTQLIHTGDTKIVEVTAGISISPNPAANGFYLPTNVNAKNISIYDVRGALVLSALNTNNYVDVSSLQRGIYIVQIQTEEGTYPVKLIKK